MNTGKKIKLIRTFRGLTQKELGEACGIHEVAIRKYELGKNIPKPEQLRKIAKALNVNVNALVEFDIEADGDVLPLLFAIDEVFDISLKEWFKHIWKFLLALLVVIIIILIILMVI